MIGTFHIPLRNFWAAHGNMVHYYLSNVVGALFKQIHLSIGKKSSAFSVLHVGCAALKLYSSSLESKHASGFRFSIVTPSYVPFLWMILDDRRCSPKYVCVYPTMFHTHPNGEET